MTQALAEFIDQACRYDPAGNLLPFTVDGVLAGWLTHAMAERLNSWPEYFSVRRRGVGMLGHFESAEHRSAAIAEVVESLAQETVIRHWRGEQVTVAESFHGPPLFHVERAATRHFGVTVYGAHLNGLTVRSGIPFMWVARRAGNKDTDPGKLDNLAAGRIARGYTPLKTMAKEGAEEAGLPEDLAIHVKCAGAVRSRREVPEGLHSEIIFVHDIILGESFVPENRDGEVCEFHCMPMREVMMMLERSPHEFTADAALVILDCLIRRGFYTSARDDYLDIIRALRP